jgi:hypothetical protein
MEIGNITRCMAKVYSLGLMVVNTKVTMSMIINRDMESSLGQMEESMKEAGNLVKWTARVITLRKKVNRK